MLPAQSQQGACSCDDLMLQGQAMELLRTFILYSRMKANAESGVYTCPIHATLRVVSTLRRQVVSRVVTLFSHLRTVEKQV